MNPSHSLRILHVLRRSGPLSRKDLAARLGLTPASLTLLAGQMLEKGLVVELGVPIATNRAGRRKVLLDIAYGRFAVLAASIESDAMTAAVCRLDGKTLSRRVLKRKDEPQHAALARLAKALGSLRDELPPDTKVMGVGVGVVGPVDRHRGMSLHAYGLWNDEVVVVAPLEQALDLPVCLENNVRALALAEIDFGGEADGRQLFLKYGPGIGSAIVIDHRLYEGAHNRSGELGHTLVAHNTLVCRCGRTGCLETVASPQALVDACGSGMTVPTLLRAVEAGDPTVARALRVPLEHLAGALINALQILDPQGLVVYGTVLNHPAMLALLAQTMTRLTGDPTAAQTLRPCRVPDDSPHLGGAALAVRRFFLGDVEV